MTNTRVTTTLSMATALTAVAAVLVSAAHAGGSLYPIPAAAGSEVSDSSPAHYDFVPSQSMAISSQRDLPQR